MPPIRDELRIFLQGSTFSRLYLLIDADDTLWENNIFFEQAISSFISYLDHRVHTHEEVRERLNLCERATVARYGYGTASFQLSLLECFEQLTDGPVTSKKHERIAAFASSVTQAPIALLPEVQTTLASLATRHRLILVTKGDRSEQEDKLQRSGLQGFFQTIEVPLEKSASIYRAIAQRHGCEFGKTWMIGNSPRSDINPPSLLACMQSSSRTT